MWHCELHHHTLWVTCNDPCVGDMNCISWCQHLTLHMPSLVHVWLVFFAGARECMNGGFCVEYSYSSEPFNGYCVCPQGYSGSYCETGMLFWDRDTHMYVRILLWCVIASLMSLHADLAQYVRPCGNSTCYNGGSHVCNDYTGTCLCRHPYTGQYCENVVG